MSETTTTTTRPSAERGDLLIQRRPRMSQDRIAAHARRRRWLERCLGVGVPVLLLLLWELAAGTLGWLDHRLYPPPSTLVQSAWHMIVTEGDFRTDVLVTLRRVLVGVVIGTATGLAVGVVTGVWGLARAALEPMLSALYVVPKLALLPIFMTIVGLGEPALVLIVSWTVFFYIWIYSMEAFIGVPDGYLEAAKSLESGRWRTLAHVLIPAALPQLFVALRVGVNVSIIMIVAAEFLAGTTGVGYVIFDARRLFKNEDMFVGIFVISIMGVVLAGLVTWLGRRLTPWARIARTTV